MGNRILGYWMQGPDVFCLEILGYWMLDIDGSSLSGIQYLVASIQDPPSQYPNIFYGMEANLNPSPSNNPRSLNFK